MLSLQEKLANKKQHKRDTKLLSFKNCLSKNYKEYAE